MRPEHGPHRREIRIRQAFEKFGMVPEFELDDVGRGATARDVIEAGGKDDLAAMGRDLVGIAAVARRFEQEIGLAEIRRHGGPERGVGFSDPAAQMGRHMQDVHYSAATGTGITRPPGAGTFGLILTRLRNLSSSMSR